jgi:hypothetical protein
LTLHANNSSPLPVAFPPVRQAAQSMSDGVLLAGFGGAAATQMLQNVRPCQ